MVYMKATGGGYLQRQESATSKLAPGRFTPSPRRHRDHLEEEEEAHPDHQDRYCRPSCGDVRVARPAAWSTGRALAHCECQAASWRSPFQALREPEPPDRSAPGSCSYPEGSLPALAPSEPPASRRWLSDRSTAACSAAGCHPSSSAGPASAPASGSGRRYATRFREVQCEGRHASLRPLPSRRGCDPSHYPAGEDLLRVVVPATKLQKELRIKQSKVQVSSAYQFVLWSEVEVVEVVSSVGSASGCIGEGTSAETFWSISESKASSDSAF